GRARRQRAGGDAGRRGRGHGASRFAGAGRAESHRHDLRRPARTRQPARGDVRPGPHRTGPGAGDADSGRIGGAPRRPRLCVHRRRRQPRARTRHRGRADPWRADRSAQRPAGRRARGRPRCGLPWRWRPGAGGGMNFSAWSIHRPLPAILVFILLTAAGLVAFNRLAVSQFPDLTVPVVNITVTLPGASPSTLETQVTRKIEDAVASIADLDDMTSIVNEGVSTTILRFDIERDGNIAKDEVRDAIDRVRIDLPRDVEPPIVSLLNVTAGDMLVFAVTADGWSDEQLSWYIDDAIAKRLFGVPGVGAVRRIGGVDREIRVGLRPEAVQGFGVSPAL